MLICVSGTPGTGKSEVSKILAKRIGYKLVRINDLAKEKNLYLDFDEDRQSWNLDMKGLAEEIKKLRESHENIILEGHVSHEFPADLVIILRCNPEVLEKRLEKKYRWPTKIHENKEVELLGIITSEAIEVNKEVYEIDTTHKKPEETVDCIREILSGRKEKYKVGRIDWLNV